jgi:hypothetical protein
MNNIFFSIHKHVAGSNFIHFFIPSNINILLLCVVVAQFESLKGQNIELIQNRAIIVIILSFRDFYFGISSLIMKTLAASNRSLCSGARRAVATVQFRRQAVVGTGLGLLK